MSDREEKTYKKGFFTKARLSVAGNYVYPARQWRPYVLGALIAAPILGIFVYDAFAGRGDLVSNGPLSSNHALFGQDCATCHDPYQAVTNARCESCHEKVGAPVGVYGFEAHYRYRSDDFDRSAPASSEMECFACHTEHVGGDEMITRVDNARCSSCHFDSFTDEHPEMQFVADNLADPANLFFPHTVHVNEVRFEHELDDVERTCLYCHTPLPDGSSFEPVSFDDGCGDCHLTSGTATPDLPVRDGLDDESPGVVTLEALRASGRPGTAWAFYANPNEFQARGPNIRKRPVYHADPWIMENLRLLRSRLYPTAELADLLRASAAMPPKDSRAIYQEAIATLEARIDELRGEPSGQVQDELAALQELVDDVRERLDDPYEPLDETRFSVSVTDENPDLPPEEREALETVVNDLTEPCQECHFVDQAAIQGVQADQRSLSRAEFDHRAHIIHARCLDCHNRIPIREAAAAEEAAEPEVDHAGIVNLPSLETCRTCHAPSKATDDCVACHVFHPDKSQWSNLLRYGR